jgi:hypothetical protein
MLLLLKVASPLNILLWIAILSSVEWYTLQKQSLSGKGRR